MKKDNTMSIIAKRINESIEVKRKIAGDAGLIGLIEKAAQVVTDGYRAGKGRIFFAGNGGSASDAQHLAAELVSRFYLERPGLAAEALNTNTSVITAIGNDYSFDRAFARQIESNAKKGDVFFALSTSGNSKNIIEAIHACVQIGVTVIGMTGGKGGKMAGLCDILIKVPSDDTPRIQESHITIGHILCEMVESRLFGK